MKNSIVFENDWDLILKDELKKPYFIKLMDSVEKDYQKFKVYPKYENIFNAFKLTSYQNVKVVIIGQDPYHQENQAHGLSFSVQKGNKIPKSLNNIYLELVDDINLKYPNHGDLTFWTNQGVLLLNTVLTVKDSNPGSHRLIGWEIFSDHIINILNQKERPVVFLLWGNDAKNKEYLITSNKHLILKSAHPSPLSAYRGFFGCKHFSKTNQFLAFHQIEPINWQI